MSSPATAHPAPSAGPLAFFIDLEPPTGDFLADAVEGLSRTPRTLPPKYFYDQRGSELFDEICRLDEYYVTRTELKLLGDIAPDVADRAGPGADVIEFGSGSSWKIRILLDGLRRPASYTAIDISGEHLRRAAEEIAADYPDVRVGAISADFTRPIDLPKEIEGPGLKLGFLPGSTIGNLRPAEARAFLQTARSLLGHRGALLIGADLIKDVARLKAAYDDASGVTAAFNLNILTRLRDELGAELDVDGFRHEARFNETDQRIEMHLVATGAQQIELGGKRFTFADGDSIHTENSHKYTIAGFQDLARSAGFEPEKVWTDPDELFSIHWLSC